jgi:hypothetical protein
MKDRVNGFVTSVVLILLAIPVLAHHSFSAEYDGNKPVSVKGVVAKVAWVNPHAYIYVETKDATGKSAIYAFETSSPNALLRRGWTRTSLKEGEQVTVDGFLAKDPRPLPDGSIHGNARLVTMASGKTVFAGSSADDGGPAAK